MCEVSTLLQTLKIDGRPLACEHAVLIRESEAEGPGAWGISVLGLRAGELARLDGARRFSALAPTGESLSGRLRPAAGANAWHARLEGSGPLRTLREVGIP